MENNRERRGKRVMKKKLLVLVAAVSVLVMGITGCKKETKCEACEEIKKCDSYEIMGEEVWMCDDCHDALEALGDLVK